MRLGEAKKTDDLLKALNDAVERRLDLRRPWDTIWWNNIALIAGDHYTRWDPTRGDFVTPQKPEHKVQLVLNHALTVARTELAKLNKAKPIMDVVANSEDTDDIAAAKVGAQILEGFEWKFRLKRKRKQSYWWMIVTGLGAQFVGFDPTNTVSGSYEYYIDPATNDPTWDPKRVKELKEAIKEGELEQDDVVQEEPLGEIDYKTYSPFQLLPDENAIEWTDLKELITVDVVDVDVAKANWGKKARDIQPEEGLATSTINSTVMFRAGLTGATSTPPSVDNAVAVYTWWLLPGVYKGRYLEQGKMIRWCNKDVVLEESETYPFIDCRIPFAFFEHIPNATSIWPESIMTHIRHVNLEMDKTISQLIENKDYMANPMWRVALQHDLPKDIVSIPGGIIKYRYVPNVPPPEPIPGVPMPQQVEQMLDGLRTQILDISGQGEVSRGTQLPSGVRSGVQVAYLQEEDETRLGPTAENIEDGIAVMGSLTLSRVSQFYHTKRIVRMYKRNGEFDVLMFKGADVKGNTDVVTLPGSALPKSKTARQQFELELVQLGIERNPKRIRDVLELGSGEPDDIDKAAAQADRENQAMVQGVTVGNVSPYYSAGDEEGGPSGGQMMPQMVPPGGAAGPEDQTMLDPQISTMQQMDTGIGGTRSFFEGGAEAPSEPPISDGTYAPTGSGGDLEGAPTDAGHTFPEELSTEEIMHHAEPHATGAGAPSERRKRGPQAIPVFKWHNHTVHLERHYGFMTDELFERIAENHPEIVRLFNEHTAMHEQVLEQKRQQQLQQLQAMKGAPGQGGEGAVSPQPQGAPDAALQGSQAMNGGGGGAQ